MKVHEGSTKVHEGSRRLAKAHEGSRRLTKGQRAVCPGGVKSNRRSRRGIVSNFLESVCFLSPGLCILWSRKWLAANFHREEAVGQAGFTVGQSRHDSSMHLFSQVQACAPSSSRYPSHAHIPSLGSTHIPSRLSWKTSTPQNCYLEASDQGHTL